MADDSATQLGHLQYGNTSDGGYLSLFTCGSYTQQWKYTDAPDADARSIQALYWAQQYSNGNSTVASLLPLAAKLGDYLRYSFFDKYFKEQGCQSTSCPVENGTKNSSAYLLSWYYAWGGAVPADGSACSGFRRPGSRAIRSSPGPD